MARRASAILLLACALLAAQSAPAQDDGSDAAALGELDGMLSNPAARAENAAGDPNAAQAEGLFAGFPPYAQQELNSIVMQVMQESGEGATKHTDAYAGGGAQAAEASFSPSVRARIAALEKRLAADPSFNTPENLARMRTLFPAFLGQPAR